MRDPALYAGQQASQSWLVINEAWLSEFGNYAVGRKEVKSQCQPSVKASP